MLLTDCLQLRDDSEETQKVKMKMMWRWKSGFISEERRDEVISTAEDLKEKNFLWRLQLIPDQLLPGLYLVIYHISQDEQTNGSGKTHQIHPEI